VSPENNQFVWIRHRNLHYYTKCREITPFEAHNYNGSRDVKDEVNTVNMKKTFNLSH